MPIELRVVVVLLVVDFGLGVWMRLHAERWLTFFLTHLPVLGVAGIAWGLMPDDAKAWLRDRLRRALGERRVLGALTAAAVALVAGSLTCSTVHVESADAGTRTRLQLVAGERSSDDTARLATAASLPLTRLQPQAVFRVWLPPTGRRVWVYAPGRATAPRLVLPWVPTRVAYPDDFDTLVTVAALPAPSLLAYMGDSLHAPTLTLRDALDSTTTLARVAFSETSGPGLRGALIAFPETSAPDSATLGTWRATLRRLDPTPDAALDSVGLAERERSVDRTLAGWRAAPSVRSVKPLVIGDSVRWDVRLRDSVLVSGATRLTHVITTIYINP